MEIELLTYYNYGILLQKCIVKDSTLMYVHIELAPN